MFIIKNRYRKANKQVAPLVSNYRAKSIEEAIMICQLKNGTYPEKLYWYERV